MAARLNPRHQLDVRRKIQASQLINRLMNHVNGENDMANSQVKAAEILLRKCLPDLSQVEGAGDDGAHVLRVIHESA